MNETLLNKQNNYFSVKRIIAMALSVTATLCYLYFAINQVFKPYVESLTMAFDQMKSGIEVPVGSYLVPVFVLLILTFVFSIAPVIGVFLPNSCKKASLIIMMIPFGWQFADVVPSVISAVAQKAPFEQVKAIYALALAAICVLAAVILIAVDGKKEAVSEEEEIEFIPEEAEFTVEYFEEPNEDAVEEVQEATEEEIEAVEESGDELFEEVKEEIEEEIKEEN